jgi:uroporphyrinogen decarboxylase
MTPRERVKAALNHQEPDRVPLDLGQAVGDGITLTAYRNLLAHLGMSDQTIQVKDKRGQTARVDEDILRRFHIDFRGVGLGAPERWKDRWLDERTFEDEWGVVRTMPKDSYYFDLVGSPLAEDGSLSALETYRWPDPMDPGRFRGRWARTGPCCPARSAARRGISSGSLIQWRRPGPRQARCSCRITRR